MSTTFPTVDVRGHGWCIGFYFLLMTNVRRDHTDPYDTVSVRKRGLAAPVDAGRKVPVVLFPFLPVHDVARFAPTQTLVKKHYLLMWPGLGHEHPSHSDGRELGLERLGGNLISRHRSFFVFRVSVDSLFCGYRTSRSFWWVYNMYYTIRSENFFYYLNRYNSYEESKKVNQNPSI